jgi:hypothetical protein
VGRLLAVLALAAALCATALAAPPAKERAAWRAKLHWPASCERDWQSGHPSTSGVYVWRTAAGGRLVAVSCILGAYQGTQRLWLLNAAGRPAPLTLHVYADPGSGKPTPMRKREILGGMVFAPASGRLTLLDKARGLGDCGIYSVFRLSGARLVPVETRAKTACDGKLGGGPARWPKLPTLTP